MLRVSGQNLDIGDALRAHVQSRVADALSKYFDRNYSGHVTVKKEGTGFRTDCLIHLSTGLTLQTESVAHDPHASVDLAAERLTRRLKRYTITRPSRRLWGRNRPKASSWRWMRRICRPLISRR